MPSVGTRMSTRVFGARVLRSGRRLWTGPGDVKYLKSTNGDGWIELLKNSGDGGGGANLRKERGRLGNDAASKQEVTGMDVDGVAESAPEKVVHDVVVAGNHVGRRWGLVYSRKRKMVDSSVVESSVNGDKKRNVDDKRSGKQFFRMQRQRKKARQTDLADACASNVDLVALEDSLDSARCLVVFVSSCSSWHLVTCFLNSILRYMRRARIGLQQLSAFVHSKTIAAIYSSHGICILQGSNLVAKRGVCLIWGSSSFVPLFAVDYSAVPYCFMYLHSRMLLHFARMMCSLGPCSLDIDEKNDKMTIPSMLIESVQVLDELAASVSDCSAMMEMPPSNVCAGKLAGRDLQLRSGRNIQMRSSWRSKRGRRPSSFGAQKANGGLASNLFNASHNSNQLSPIASIRELMCSTDWHTAANIKQVKSAMAGLKQDVDPTSCCANILVMESDKCSREEGAIVTLEVSGEKQWHLAIKRDGLDRYRIITQKFMRPCSCNRFTHAIIWGTESGWKLEFTNRRDWSIFKKLYKKCSDRNADVPAESSIPIPGVHEVSGYVSSSSFFVRPASYISVKDDELSRALARRTSNYDMDSDDEEWLNKFNSEVCSEIEFPKMLSAENFELVIDAFERGVYCNPDNFSNETTPNICLNLESRVVEAVYSFWIKKRKQRHAALVRIFQLYQRRRAQFIPNSVLRKKRSFKRQGSQIGRGKQCHLLKGMAAEQDAQEQQNLKVEEARTAANRSEGLAILKRQRAQQLMQNADLATYKATMALKIAELAQIAESTAAVDLLFVVE